MKKKTLVELSVIRKKEVIDLMDRGVSGAKIASQFGVSPSTVSSIKKNRETIISSWEGNCSSDRKRKIRSNEKSELNAKVMQFFTLCRQKNIPVSGPLIQEKAIQIAALIGIPDFNASNGWLEKFRLRHNIDFRVLRGESADLDESAASTFKCRIPSIIDKYDVKDVFNADETGLFYLALPTRSLIQRGESSNGGKQSKERLSILLTTSMLGEKLKPLVIGHAAYPRAFRKANITVDNLPVYWRSNKKAWMTSSLFTEWLQNLNKKMRFNNRRILLFVDNAPSHAHVPLSNIELYFLPPNMTSAVQPLDQGIIQNFKTFYRKFLLQKLVSVAESCTCASDFTRQVSVLDAIRWIVCSWRSVKAETIQKCFRSCGFKSLTAGKVS